MPFCRANVVEWAKILDMLDLYERGFGQKLNKDKTSIYFNVNTKRVTRDYNLGAAGFRAILSYEKYLGLSALIGRSRVQAFKGILDRVRSRVSNWKINFYHKLETRFYSKLSFKLFVPTA